MMGRVLELTLALLDCDRAWLLYPCDPEAPSWRVRTERVRLDLAAASPGALDCAHSDDARRRATCRPRFWRRPVQSSSALEANDSIPEALRLHFGIQSRLAMAIRPKTAAPTPSGCINVRTRAFGPPTTGSCSKRSAAGSKTR